MRSPRCLRARSAGAVTRCSRAEAADTVDMGVASVRLGNGALETKTRLPDAIGPEARRSPCAREARTFETPLSAPVSVRSGRIRAIDRALSGAISASRALGPGRLLSSPDGDRTARDPSEHVRG